MAVKDAIVTSNSEDRTLDVLIELTVHSIKEKRPLFNDILTEPAFYRRYFYRWVKEGLAELEEMQKIAQGKLNGAE